MTEEQKKNLAIYTDIEDLAKFIQKQDNRVQYYDAMVLAEKIYAHTKPNSTEKAIEAILTKYPFAFSR